MVTTAHKPSFTLVCLWIIKGVRIMKWTVILDNGKTYSVIADNLLDISLKLQERDLITADYDIIAVIRIPN